MGPRLNTRILLIQSQPEDPISSLNVLIYTKNDPSYNKIREKNNHKRERGQWG